MEQPRVKRNNYKNKEWLETQYTHKGMSLTDIAEHEGCCVQTIWYFMKKFGIERRDPQDAKIIKWKKLKTGRK